MAYWFCFFCIGEDFVRERSADGRQTAWIVPSLSRLRWIRKLSIESDEQERQNNFGNISFISLLHVRIVIQGMLFSFVVFLAARWICHVCYTSQRWRSQARLAGNISFFFFFLKCSSFFSLSSLSIFPSIVLFFPVQKKRETWSGKKLIKCNRRPSSSSSSVYIFDHESSLNVQGLLAHSAPLLWVFVVVSFHLTQSRQRRQQFLFGDRSHFREGWGIRRFDILFSFYFYDSILGGCSCCVMAVFVFFILKTKIIKRKKKENSGWVGNDFQWEGNELSSSSGNVLHEIYHVDSITNLKKKNVILFFFFLFIFGMEV